MAQYVKIATPNPDKPRPATDDPKLGKDPKPKVGRRFGRRKKLGDDGKES